MMRRIIPIAFFLFVASQVMIAQPNLKDSVTSLWYLQPHISFQVPQGDMQERFFPNTAVGFGLIRKTDRNWLFGLEMSYLFAEKVKNEDLLLSNITTSEGFVIDQTGVFANIHFRQRGFYAQAKTGKIFPTRFGNPNSGILVMGSLGLLQHKIRIEVHENTAPQLSGDYKKGYDKLTNGPAASLYFGYNHFSNNKLTNYSIGAEYIYGSTQSRRDYDFVLMRKDETVRRDQLLSFRFTWIIPFYQRVPKEFYFN
jgi:hypothetical protein